jgi:hypothetical protein
MPVERRGQVTRVLTNTVNWKQEEPSGQDGRQQPSLGGTSRVTGDSQARFCERLGVKFPGPTRLGKWNYFRVAHQSEAIAMTSYRPTSQASGTE